MWNFIPTSNFIRYFFESVTHPEIYSAPQPVYRLQNLSG